MTLPTRYVTMTFGSDDFRYWQAHWCLLGLIAYAPLPCEIVMVTDHPEYFRWFGGSIRLHQVDAKEWIGSSGYFLRTLIKTVELGLELQPTADMVVYTDTDSVAARDLAPLIAGVRAGHILLDRREYQLAHHRSPGSRTLWKQVGGRLWAGVDIPAHIEMWNTGITALSQAEAPRIAQALAATDAILAAGGRHFLTEQIAMSAALTHDGMAREVNPVGQSPLIKHYWGNKDGWNARISGHLATIHQRNLSVAEAAVYLRDHPIDISLIVKRRWWHRLLRVEPKRT